MRIVDDIIVLLAAACRLKSAALISVAMQTARRLCLVAWLLGASVALLLGTLGLMIAALFMGLAPHLGPHWAAMIAAGASLGASGMVMAIAIKVSSDR